MSGHGFGHAVRVAQVVEEFLDRGAGRTVHVRGSAPPWLFPDRPGRIFFHENENDVGVAQPDGLTLDLGTTLRRLERLERARAERIETEREWLTRVGANVVLADLPPIAFDGADAARIPSVALGNFSWDWIYRSYEDREPGFARHARAAAEAYAKARFLLRLPFHGDMTVFREIRDISLIARRSSASRENARRELGLPARPIVLLSFGGLGFREIATAGLGALRDVQFVATERYPSSIPNLLVLDPRRISYDRLLRAADVVVTKPGYGIVAAALANEVRVLYTDRGSFPEYPILRRALEEFATAAFIDRERLERGDFRDSLERLLEVPPRACRLSFDGAAEAAAALAEAA